MLLIFVQFTVCVNTERGANLTGMKMSGTQFEQFCIVGKLTVCVEPALTSFHQSHYVPPSSLPTPSEKVSCKSRYEVLVALLTYKEINKAHILIASSK